MLFSSTPFLFVFLPIVCIMYLLIKPSLRNYWLLFASLFFYAWGEPRYLSVMLFVVLLNYVVALLFEKYPTQKKLLLFTGVLANLGILVFFKYTNFIIENINLLLNLNVPDFRVVMPIGISFFIFQSMSYIVDVYRTEVKCQQDVRKLALYISLFPQLIAGPIVKYHDIEKSIDDRSVNMDDVLYGVRRFIIGLSKKVLLANSMGSVADNIYATTPNELTASVAWVGAVAYSLQIFYDFSGYSDMAIGLGRLFGFRFLENFNYPYIASSITDFWRRWHISLSSWFKQYLYIPLGGNRNGDLATTRNLLIVFLATGIWHGASWNFVVWGLWHGFFLILEKKFKFITSNKFLGHFYTIIVFVIGWVFFRADNLHIAFEYLQAMFGLNNPTIMSSIEFYVNRKDVIISVFALLFCVPLNFEKLKQNNYLECGYNLVLLCFLFLSIVSIAASTYNPFIYFRF